MVFEGSRQFVLGWMTCGATAAGRSDFAIIKVTSPVQVSRYESAKVWMNLSQSSQSEFRFTAHVKQLFALHPERLLAVNSVYSQITAVF
jgi:hypothetical protein